MLVWSRMHILASFSSSWEILSEPQELTCYQISLAQQFQPWDCSTKYCVDEFAKTSLLNCLDLPNVINLLDYITLADIECYITVHVITRKMHKQEHMHYPISLQSYQGCPQDVKSQDRDETKTFDFSKLSRPRRSTLKTETRRSRKTSRDHLETETFKTETTSLIHMPFNNMHIFYSSRV